MFDDVTFHHRASLSGMRHRTVTHLGPSTTEQMSVYRVDVIVAPEAITRVIAEVLSVTAIRAPVYPQHALAGWLGDDQEYVAKRLREYAHVRQIAHEAVSALPFVRVPCPQATPYTFSSVRLLQRTDLAVARALLTEADVLVIPGHEFGPRGVGSLRICFALDADVLRAALERIAATLSGLDAAPVSARTAV